MLVERVYEQHPHDMSTTTYTTQLQGLALFSRCHPAWASEAHQWVPARTPTVHWGPYEGAPWVAQNKHEERHVRVPARHTLHMVAVGLHLPQELVTQGGDPRTDHSKHHFLSFVLPFTVQKEMTKNPALLQNMMGTHCSDRCSSSNSMQADGRQLQRFCVVAGVSVGD